MSYWPALDCPSWNALEKKESYGAVRNDTSIPVACLNIGRIVSLNGLSAPSSNAPITSFPPSWAVLALAEADGATDAEAAAEAAADADGALHALAAELAAGAALQAARNAPAAAAPPSEAPRRSTSRRVRWRDRISSLIGSPLLPGSSVVGRRDARASRRRCRRSTHLPDRRGRRPGRRAALSSLGLRERSPASRR